MLYAFVQMFDKAVIKILESTQEDIKKRTNIILNIDNIT
jgi:hypothetical protein